MCGRFTQTSPLDLIIVQCKPTVHRLKQIKPRYNIAPTQDVLAVRVNKEGHRELVELRWGLIPFFAIEPGKPLINARAETVDKKPSFGPCFRQRRCLIPADGFYEWKKEGKSKQPYLIETGELFAFAGLWSTWSDD